MPDAAWQALAPVLADLGPAPRTPADPFEARRGVAIAAIKRPSRLRVRSPSHGII